MKVIVAEKPDQGAKLAAPFSTKKGQGYIEIKPHPLFPDGAIVTWAVGHLCELVPPEEYDPSYKKWSLSTLPILPNQFRHKVTPSKYKQFMIVKSLLKRPDVTEIIMAGDAGREGEYITRIIIQLAGVRKPLKRLWISSLTEKAVLNGFAALKDESATRPLYDEALSRSCADWLIGMNGSRVYSLLFQKRGIREVFSTGRVQTPTLSLIVKREKEIESFVPEPFWEVLATFNMSGMQYVGKWFKDDETRLTNPEMAHKIAAFCHGKPARVEEVQTERKETPPPLLFNLSALQSAANKAFKFSPKKTLDVTQQLYVKGFVSYPRSDSQHVTAEEAALFTDILAKLGQQSLYQAYIPTPVSSLLHNRRYVDPKKVTDHYAIIPTEQVPDMERLSADERKMYELIAKRLIAAHYDVAIFDHTTIVTKVDGRATFRTKGKREVQEGWRRVLFDGKKKKQKAEKNDEEDMLLPDVHMGADGMVVSVDVKESKTQPPKRYTEGDLITVMKTAGKHMDDAELEKVMHRVEGLGTEATRAGIITVLKDRGYIEVSKNLVYATDKGRMLVEAVGASILSSAEMTAKWEQRLHEIGQGKAASAPFMEQARKLATHLVDEAIKQAETWEFTGIDEEALKAASAEKRGRGKLKGAPVKVGVCKKCGGDMLDRSTFYGCARYQETKCDFTLPKKMLGKTISQANVRKLLAGQETDTIKGFKKGEKTFDARLKWDEVAGKIAFIFPPCRMGNEG